VVRAKKRAGCRVVPSTLLVEVNACLNLQSHAGNLEVGNPKAWNSKGGNLSPQISSRRLTLSDDKRPWRESFPC
jgi:hypothetical protein